MDYPHRAGRGRPVFPPHVGPTFVVDLAGCYIFRSEKAYCADHRYSPRVARLPAFDVSRPSPARVTAFVGRSFLPEDDELWHELRLLLEALQPFGFAFEDAKEAQPRPVSEKVREGIKRNDIYIGLLSHRGVITAPHDWLAGFRSPSKWSTSGWVIQESGYALGLGKPVVLLIEDGVDFPVANLNADTEWIGFRRDAVSQIGPRLTAMMGHFLAATFPTTTAVALAASEIAVAPTAEPAPQVPSFSEIRDMIHEGKLSEADAAFERLVPQFGGASRWFTCYYLRLKAVRGDQTSLDKLRSRLVADPSDDDARIELAAYYEHFQNYREAIAVILAGLPTATDRESKRTLLSRAARTASLDVDYDSALKFIRQLHTDEQPGEQATTFEALADVAKDMKQAELEAAALEAVLHASPSNAATRFRLAYLYAENQKRRLAIYHYSLRLGQSRDASSLNNLAISFGTLKLHAREIEVLREAAPDTPMARANLAHAYVDRGFLDAAEEQANSVLSDPNADEAQKERAAGALNRARSMRTEETESEGRIMGAAKRASEFRARYAAGYLEKRARDVNGLFESPQGQFELMQDGAELLGIVTRPIPTLRIFSTGDDPERRTVTLKFHAEVTGRTGVFTMRAGEAIGRGTTLLTGSSSDPSTTHGLAIIAEDGLSLEILEELDDVPRVYIATAAPARSSAP